MRKTFLSASGESIGKPPTLAVVALLTSLGYNETKPEPIIERAVVALLTSLGYNK